VDDGRGQETQPKHQKLYALPWAWPGFLRNSSGVANPLLDNTADASEYVSSWVQGIRDVQGLIIDFLSIWNEMDKQLQAGAAPYIKQLRKDLDRRGLHTTKIVA